MTARPITLEHALHDQGYTIDLTEQDEITITTPFGALTIPPAIRSVLTWQRGTDQPPALGDDLFLSSLPIFNDAYRPVLLSTILDRYRTRRLGYNTPGEWRLAFRRWGNLHMTTYNQRYATLVSMPLDEIEVTRHDLTVGSDFPQSLISDDQSYASSAADLRSAENGRRRSTAALLIEQRDAFLNVDAEIVDDLDSLFLGQFDRGELARPDYSPPGGAIHPWHAGAPWLYEYWY